MSSASDRGQRLTVLRPRVDAYREVLRECASFNLRKASRIVSQLYDDILQPTGLRSTQVALLVLLAVEPESSMARLARQVDAESANRQNHVRCTELSFQVVRTSGADDHIDSDDT